jgi:hypothetical protein
MSLFPRQRQLSPPRIRGGGDANTALESGDAELEINRAVLSGVIAAEPQRDQSRDGDPITVLLVSFTAPDQRSHHAAACCEIEILDKLADPHRRSLKAGMRVAVVGQLTGAGGLWASHIITPRPKPSPS